MDSLPAKQCAAWLAPAPTPPAAGPVPAVHHQRGKLPRPRHRGHHQRAQLGAALMPCEVRAEHGAQQVKKIAFCSLVIVDWPVCIAVEFVRAEGRARRAASAWAWQCSAAVLDQPSLGMHMRGWTGSRLSARRGPAAVPRQPANLNRLQSSDAATPAPCIRDRPIGPPHLVRKGSQVQGAAGGSQRAPAPLQRLAVTVQTVPCLIILPSRAHCLQLSVDRPGERCV